MIATYSLCEGMGIFIWGQLSVSVFVFVFLWTVSVLPYNIICLTFSLFLCLLTLYSTFWSEWFYVLWLKNDTLWKRFDWLTGKVLTWFLYLFETCMYEWDYSESINVAALNSLWCPIGQVCTIFISNIVNISWLKNDDKL